MVLYSKMGVTYSKMGGGGEEGGLTAPPKTPKLQSLHYKMMLT